MFNTIFILNLVATLVLVGLIWVIQCLHYPMFSRIGVDEFTGYLLEHSRRITPIVAPLMILELTTSLLLALGFCPAWVPRWVAILGFAMVLGIWGSTFLIQVPCHNKLIRGFDNQALTSLVVTNWIRTLLWTTRATVLVFCLGKALQQLDACQLK